MRDDFWENMVKDYVVKTSMGNIMIEIDHEGLAEERLSVPAMMLYQRALQNSKVGCVKECSLCRE